jgi:hypothetical protein
VKIKSVNAIGLAGVLLGTAAGHANITGGEITVVDFSAGYVNADGTINASGAAEVAAAWATFSDDYEVIRLWATVDTVNATVAAFAGSDDMDFELILDPGTGGVFYNNIFGGMTAPIAAAFPFFPEAAFDSFATIGSSDNSGATVNFQDTGNAFNGFAGLVQNDNIAWYFAPPVAGAGVVSDGAGGYRVLLAQLTVPACVEGFVVQGIIAGGGDLVSVYFDDDSFPQAACCLPDMSCAVMRECACEAAGGEFQSGSPSCSAGLCVDPALQCPADCAPANMDGTFGDGTVDHSDLLAVIMSFGIGDGETDVDPDNGDGTFGNGVVNIEDLFTVLTSFGACPS